MGIVSEAELQHYVDGRLDPERQAFVESYLRLYPEELERITAYQKHRSALRAIFLTEPQDTSGQFDLLRISATRRRLDDVRLRSMAAAVVIFVLGGGIGWLSHGFAGRLSGGEMPFPRTPAAPYRTLGSGDARPDANVVVVFRPEASEADVRQLLRSADARFVDGPTATDGYMLHVAPERREQFLRALHRNRDVTLAEPLDAD